MVKKFEEFINEEAEVIGHSFSRNEKPIICNVTDIDWAVEPEDGQDEEDVATIKEGLPTEVKIELYHNEIDDDLIDNVIANKLSDEYGWLVNTFTYSVNGTYEK